MNMGRTNSVILICSSNNYNELGLVRSFGECRIRPFGIIICKKNFWKKEWVHRSKYWEKCFRVDSAEQAIELLEKNFSNFSLKPVVITPIDYVVQMLDKNYEQLSKTFILPNMGEKNNGINDFASKLKQAELTKSLGFEALPTKIMYMDNFSTKDILENEYPLLLKPVQGGEGAKDDITICKTKQDLSLAIEFFRKKAYKRILVQSYLENRQEIVAFGTISKEKNLVSYTTLSNIRQWPLSYGVGSFAKLVTEEETNSLVKDLFTALKNFGYDGAIDVELFRDKDTGKFYVSEYNWRPGGRNFTSLGTKVYSIVLWYLVKTGQHIKGLKVINDKNGYSMNDMADFNHVLAKNISRKDWKKDYKRSCAYALRNRRDVKPTIIPRLTLLKDKIKGFFKKR